MSSGEAIQLTEYLAQAAMQLPLTERADLAHRILASLDEPAVSEAPDETYLDELAIEIERRAKSVLRGEAHGRDAADALAQLRDTLKRRRTSCD